MFFKHLGENISENLKAKQPVPSFVHISVHYCISRLRIQYLTTPLKLNSNINSTSNIEDY